MPGTLYIVSTPIGNLEDITYRAVKVLQQASLIACEDTRQTRKLLTHFSVQTPTQSLHEHNEIQQTQRLLGRMEANEDIALVSDAGTPLISDPGFRLVRAVLDRGYPIVPVPGASSVLAALAGGGLPTDEFTFVGFLPPKRNQRLRELEARKGQYHTLVFLEAPHRIQDSLQDIRDVLGDQTEVVVARELTKLHEEFLRGPVAQVLATLSGRPAIKGEITLLVLQQPPPADQHTPESLRNEVSLLTQQGLPRMDAIKQVAKKYGMGKRDLYTMCEDHHP